MKYNQKTKQQTVQSLTMQKYLQSRQQNISSPDPYQSNKPPLQHSLNHQDSGQFRHNREYLNSQRSTKKDAHILQTSVNTSKRDISSHQSVKQVTAMKDSELHQPVKNVQPFRSLNNDHDNAKTIKDGKMHKHLKIGDSSHLQQKQHNEQLWQQIREIKENFAKLKEVLLQEIYDVRERVLVLEQNNNMSLREIKDKLIDDIELGHQNENIKDDNYRSKKREINELSIHIDPPPTVKLNLRHLGQQEPFQKQIIKDLKREIREQSIQDKLKGKSIPCKSQSKERLHAKRPITSLKDPKSLQFYPSMISPMNNYHHDETEQESPICVVTTQTVKHMHEANTPIESPQRKNENYLINKNMSLIEQSKARDQSKIQSFVNAMTLSERIQANNTTAPNTHSKSKSSSKYALLNKTHIEQPQRNDTNELLYKNTSSVEDASKKKGALGLQALVESPKFMKFVNSNTARQTSSSQLNHSSHQKHHHQLSFKLLPQSQKPQAPKINEQVKSNKDIEDEGQLLTDRSQQKPSINDKVLLNSGRFRKQQQDRPLKNPLIKNYMHHRPQTNNAIHNMQDESSDETLNSDDCDEKRSYTPEPRHLEKLANKLYENRNLNHSIIGIKGQSLSTSMSGVIGTYQGVNSVYKSSKMEISKYISKNKSHIDYQNTQNLMEAILENKGSKCTCSKQSQKQEVQYGQVCGEYCKMLGSRDQKRIILECLMKELSQTKTSKKIKRYLIDAKWIRKWCDYTNFDTNLLSSSSFDSIKDAFEDFLSQSGHVESQRTLRYDSSTLYQKPLKIKNEGLLDPDYKGNQKRLRENLVENFDFLSVSPKIWMHFYSWYSADSQIVRYLKRDKFNQKQYVLELYPHLKQEKLNLSYMGPQHQTSEEDSESENEQLDQDMDSPQLRTKSKVLTTLQSQLPITNKLFNAQMQAQKGINKTIDIVSGVRR